MDPKQLKASTYGFARAVMRFCGPFFVNRTRDVAGQLQRSGTGVDANYGSAQEARSPDEFVSKMGQVVDDAKESRGWLQLLSEDPLLKDAPDLPWLVKEADELTRIFAKSYRTARANNLQRKTQERQIPPNRRKARR